MENIALKKETLKKLKLYAGTTAGFLAVSGAVNGQINYTNIVDFTVSTLNDTYKVDLNNDNNAELEIFAKKFLVYGGSIGNYNTIYKKGIKNIQNNFEFIGTDLNKQATPLDFGNALTGNFVANGTYTYNGLSKFTSTGDKYIGCRFKIDSKYHYGWIRVSVGLENVLIKDFAYNLKADETIITGLISNINKGITLSIGSKKAISNEELSKLIIETTNSNIVYTVTTGTTKGYIEKTTNSGVAITSFTQEDINNNTIQYVHTGTTTGTDQFSFSVSNGTNTLVNQTFAITISTANDIKNANGNNASVNIWFNQTTQMINVATESEIENVEILNLSGSTLMKKEINSAQTEINIDNLNKGVYLVKVNTATDNFTQKIIKD